MVTKLNGCEDVHILELVVWKNIPECFFTVADTLKIEDDQ